MIQPEDERLIRVVDSVALIPSGGTPVLSEIVSRSLVHIKTSKTLTMPVRRAGEEQEFEIAPGIWIVMCWCPPGHFTMGSSEEERFGDDIHQRNDENKVAVELTNGFWLAKTEITQLQWKAVVGNNPSHFKGDSLPVESITWGEVQEFIKCVNTSGTLPEDWKMALPTEAQWEYACRAGEAGAYYGGTIDEVAWYCDNSDEKTHPVATKKPNAWGLHDMHGNVAELCQDWHSVRIKGFPDNNFFRLRLKGGEDPKGPELGSLQVIRGGSHVVCGGGTHVERGGSFFCESTYTRHLHGKLHYNASDDRCSNLGFRPALVLFSRPLGSAKGLHQNDLP
jgi:formylglycine-generating enzyme required for sulfatase activity